MAGLVPPRGIARSDRFKLLDCLEFAEYSSIQSACGGAPRVGRRIGQTAILWAPGEI
jgi:hypothetical protein